MDEKTYLGKQLELIDTIVNSADNLIPVLKRSPVTNETISKTIAEIFRFFGNIIESMPDVLIADKEVRRIKQKLVYAIYSVRVSWEEFDTRREDFFADWAKMVETWHKYKATISELEKTPGTMFLSMN